MKSQYWIPCLVSVISRPIWSCRHIKSSISGSLSDIHEPRTDPILDVNLSKESEERMNLRFINTVLQGRKVTSSLTTHTTSIFNSGVGGAFVALIGHTDPNRSRRDFSSLAVLSGGRSLFFDVSNLRGHLPFALISR